MSDETSLPESLTQYGCYEWPTGPASETLSHYFQRLLDKLGVSERSRAINRIPQSLNELDDNLFGVEQYDLLSAHLHTLLDEYYVDDPAQAQDRPVKHLCLHGPGTPVHIFKDWAQKKGYRNLRIQELAFGDDNPDKTPVIITNLHEIVERSLNGLAALREGTYALARYNAPFLIVCNSWTWRYMQMASDMDLLLSSARSVPAFDANALAYILRKTLPGRTFLSEESGGDILETNKSGTLKDPMLRSLAARSLGCPWTAMELLHVRKKKKEKDKDQTTQKGDENAENSIYVSLPKRMTPADDITKQVAFLLHMLLIHGEADLHTMSELLPMPISQALLVSAGQVGLIATNDQGRIYIPPAAYPDIRHLLTGLNFPMDVL